MVGQPDEEKGAGQVPVAFLVLKDSEKGGETVEKVKEMVEKSVADEYFVKRYVVLEKLPLTPNDKIDYKSLEEMRGDQSY